MQADEISEQQYWLGRTDEGAALVGQDWTGMSDFVKTARDAAHQAGAKLPFMANFDVLIDDQLRNIRNAADVGMKTVHFDVRNPAQGYAEAFAKLGLSEEISL